MRARAAGGTTSRRVKARGILKTRTDRTRGGSIHKRLGRAHSRRQIIRILRETPYQESAPLWTSIPECLSVGHCGGRRWPEVRAALGNPPVGGLGVGTRNSLAQYLAGELSRRIKSSDLTTVEGAFLTDEDLVELVYVESDGRRVTSSLIGSGYDLSLFRLRPTS